MQHGPSGLTGIISGNKHPRRFIATQSQAELLPADPPSPSRRRGRSEYPVPSQDFYQASMFSSSPSHGCASLTYIPCNKDRNNFLYTRPSLKRTSAPQFQDTPSEVPIVYSSHLKTSASLLMLFTTPRMLLLAARIFPCMKDRPNYTIDPKESTTQILYLNTYYLRMIALRRGKKNYQQLNQP